MPDNVTAERTQLLEMYGAEIVYSEGAKGSNGAVEVALEMAKDSKYYMPYQYGNEANPNAHYNGTAVEILEELDEVTAFVGGLGTGGTLMGNGRRFKEHDPETKIVAAEPMQGELVSGLRSLDDGFIPPIIDLTILAGSAGSSARPRPSRKRSGCPARNSRSPRSAAPRPRPR
jgi:cysteine synthase B